MKIIDFELYQYEDSVVNKKTTVKLYLGDDDLEKWWGAGWSRIPYERKAGQVYSNYVSEVVDLVVSADDGMFFYPTDYTEGTRTHTHYSKEHILARMVPFMVILPHKCTSGLSRGYHAWTFLDAMGLECSKKVYFGDKFPFPGVELVNVKSPMNILKEQCECLVKRTHYFVGGELLEPVLDIEDRRCFDFCLTDAEGNYHYKLLTIRLSHRIEMYPAEIITEKSVLEELPYWIKHKNGILKAHSQDAFTEILKAILATQKVSHIVNGIIALHKGEERTS